MLIFLNKSFMDKRPSLKKSIIDIIQRTVDQVQSNMHPGLPHEKEDVVVLVDGLPNAEGELFRWADYKDKHKVAIKFMKDEKPNKQWYKNEHGVTIVECFSPSKVINWAEGYPAFYYAFEKALNFKYYAHMAEKAKNINYHVLKSFKDPAWEELCNYKGLIGSDIETRGFNFREDAIMVSGFCILDKDRVRKTIIVPQSVIESSHENRRQFRAFMENQDHKFCWQNGKFDTKFFRHLNIDARVDEDIMLMQYAQDERGKGILGLEYQATKVLNTDGYKHQIDFATVDPQDPKLHYYLAQDCIYTHLLYEHHWMMMHKKGSEHSYELYKNILLKASWALTRLEENGFYVNRPYALQLEKDFRTKLEIAESTLNDIAIQAGYTPESFVKWSGQKKLPDKFSSNAPKQLAYVLIELLGLPRFKNTNTTNIKAMLHWLFDILDFPNKDSDAFLDTPSDVVDKWLVSCTGGKNDITKVFLWNLLNYRKLKKMYSTYILNAVKYSAKDGRVHATFKIHGTVTGRLSSGDPMNLQNIPRRKDIKNMFKAPEGKTLMECDYSQAELRILAYLSQDPDMIKTYVDDGDLHDAVAIKMFGPDFTKEQRVGAKTVNFGLAYGRGKASVAEQLRCTFQFASDLVDQWHASMPVASKFISETRAKPKRGEKCTTPLGRERRFWLLNHKNENTCENEAINFPIQATASDCTLVSLYRFLHILEADPIKWEGVFPVNIVHDAILVEAPDDKVDMTAKVLMECMCETPKTIMPDLNVPLKADAEVTKIGWGKKSDWEPGCAPNLPLK